MDIRQLEYFVTVARVGHFTQSAQELHVGQPALSQAIRRLERELGVDLLDRTTHPVSLTSAGEALLPHAERAVEAIAMARREFGLMGSAPLGRVTVGAMASVGPIEKIISSFHRLHPNVEVALREGITSHLMAELHSGHVDVVIATLLRPLPERVEYEVIFAEPLVLMAPPGTDYGESVALEQLDGSTVLLPPAGSGVRQIVERALIASGIAWHSGPESADVLRQRAVISNGFGCAIIPEGATTVGRDPVEFIPLTHPLHREVALMWRRDQRNSSSIRAFLDVARDGAADMARAFAGPLSGQERGD